MEHQRRHSECAEQIQVNRMHATLPQQPTVLHQCCRWRGKRQALESRLEAEEQEARLALTLALAFGAADLQLRHSVSAQRGSTCTTSCFDTTWPQLYFLSNRSWDIWIIRSCIRTLHWELFLFYLLSWKHIQYSYCNENKEKGRKLLDIVSLVPLWKL